MAPTIGDQQYQGYLDAIGQIKQLTSWTEDPVKILVGKTSANSTDIASSFKVVDDDPVEILRKAIEPPPNKTPYPSYPSRIKVSSETAAVIGGLSTIAGITAAGYAIGNAPGAVVGLVIGILACGSEDGGGGSVDRCAGITCSGHGTCHETSTSYYCNCDYGYEASGSSCVKNYEDEEDIEEKDEGRYVPPPPCELDLDHSEGLVAVSMWEDIESVNYSFSRNLIISELSGNCEKRITKDFMLSAYYPVAFSPNNKKVAMCDSHDGLFLTDLSENKFEKLYGVNGCTGPQWSPDGTKIAFLYGSGVSDPNTGIWIYDLVGKEATKHDASGKFPVWSKDGNWLIYQADQPLPGGIVKTQPDTTSKTLLAEGSTTYYSKLSISPDGKKVVAMNFDPAGNDPVGIYVINLDGSGHELLHQMETSKGHCASWDHSATHVAFTENDGVFKVNVIDAGSKDIKTVATFENPSSSQSTSCPQWSEYDNQIIVMVDAAAGLGELYLVDVNTSETEQLFPGNDVGAAIYYSGFDWSKY